MSRIWIASVFMFAFGLGCVAAIFMVPPVQAATNPTKWEYECVVAMRDVPLATRANELGKAGWEMAIAVSPSENHAVVCFKRPL